MTTNNGDDLIYPDDEQDEGDPTAAPDPVDDEEDALDDEEA